VANHHVLLLTLLRVLEMTQELIPDGFHGTIIEDFCQ